MLMSTQYLKEWTSACSTKGTAKDGASRKALGLQPSIVSNSAEPKHEMKKFLRIFIQNRNTFQALKTAKSENGLNNFCMLAVTVTNKRDANLTFCLRS